jgi:hypothetical protein
MKNTLAQLMTKGELFVASKELTKEKTTPKHYHCKILSKDMGGNGARVNSKRKFPT